MSEAFAGEIRIFAGNYAPQNWALCDGQELPIAQNEILYSLIGTTYGGDGSVNFALPNLQGRLVVGMGQGAGLQNNYAIGATAGSYTVTLTQATMPSHSHAVFAVPIHGASKKGEPRNNAQPFSRRFRLYCAGHRSGADQ